MKHLDRASRSRRGALPASFALAALAAVGVLLPSGASGQDAPPPAPATDGKEPAPADPEKPGEPAKPDEPGAPEPGKPGKPAKPPRPGKDDDGDMGPKPGKRELDTESPAAKALDELLNVDPRFAKDGTVELIYTFKDETEVGDFTAENLDRAEEAGKRGGRGRRLRGLPGEALSVGAGSTPGVLLHRLPLRDDYEAIFRCHIERTSTRSDLVFLAGKGGSAWGSCLVLRGSSGFGALGDPAIDKDAWNGGRMVTVRVAVKDGELTTQLNGATRGTKKVAGDKLDGKVGLYLSEMHLIVHRVTIRGKVDASKL